MWSRKASATSSATSASKARSATSTQRAADQRSLPMKTGDWYNAKLVEDTVDQPERDWPACSAMPSPTSARSSTATSEDLTMGVTFHVAEAPRVYVERIDINGNTLTQDKVIRREFRLAEGDRVQQRPGQALARPHPVAGLFPGQSRDRAEAGLGARPRRPRRRRRGEGDRRAAALGGLLEPRALPRQALDPPAQLPRARARSCAPAVNYSSYSQVGRARLHRALSVRPQHRGRRRHLPPRLQQLQLRRQRSQHDLRADHAPAARSARACR